jgi:acylphosphatase
MSEMTTRRLYIRGRVQGVFFRDWTVATARGFGLVGWVRNRADGSVEVLASGPADRVAAFVARCHDGPDRARVEAIDVTDAQADGSVDFGRRPTA